MLPPGCTVMTVAALPAAAAAAAAAYPNVLPGDVMSTVDWLMMMMSTCKWGVGWGLQERAAGFGGRQLTQELQ
jgi:hypothetical protein